MGVPKFYRWISERYPCLSEIVQEHQIPEFDNLYLDMNGIIHACSHPNDDDVSFRITEEQIFKDIFYYIEVLFRIIKPRKVFFMAVDGVAPRAKMNQQRGRRFRSAREAQRAEEAAKQKGEQLPDEARFDSNCITPGTAFMARLHEQLKYLVNMKITTDPSWRGIRVIYSGHETPGEGEHKIMDFIRYERSQSGYDPNTRHCLYGLDADLVMLGMCSHEPYFSLLREEVKFGKPRQGGASKGKQLGTTHKGASPDRTTFHLLHLSLLREYLGYEFEAAKEIMGDKYDLEKIIDDWLLLGFLVGNDFIPNLPHLHINTSALPTLYNTYISVLEDMGGYMNDNGRLNLARFEIFMRALSQKDYEHFCNEYEDLLWLQSKSTAKTLADLNVERELEMFDFEGVQAEDVELEDDLTGLTAELRAKLKRDEEKTQEEGHEHDETADLKAGQWNPRERPEEWSDLMEEAFVHAKVSYYRNKLEAHQVDDAFIFEQARIYVEALQWNLHYYYNGCVSWGWYFPQHYAPYVSDIRNVSQLQLTFDYGRPFLPFEQLLAVLPAASQEHVPPAFRPLMTAADSPILDYYPVNFETDLNGKQQEWEAVVQIPFIDENRLLNAMEPLHRNLTAEEKGRNIHSEHVCYTTADKPGPSYKSPGIFPSLLTCRAKATPLPIDLFRLPEKDIVKGLLPNVQLDVYVQGFPSLAHLPHSHKLTNEANVKIFNFPSKNDSIVLQLHQRDDQNNLTTLESVAKAYLGQEIFIDWPHLRRALCDGVSDIDNHTRRGAFGRYVTNKHDHNSTALFKKALDAKDGLYERRGIDARDLPNEFVLHCRPLLGQRYIISGPKVHLEKQWSVSTAAYSVPLILKDIAFRSAIDLNPNASFDCLFPVGSRVFILSQTWYGHEAEVLSVDGEACKLQLSVDQSADMLEPDMSYVAQNVDRLSLNYYTVAQIAQRLNVSQHFLYRISGTVYMSHQPKQAGADEQERRDKSSSDWRHNVGLNVKFARRDQEVAGYARRVNDEWQFSQKLVDILKEYVEKFSDFVNYMQNTNSNYNDMFYATDIFISPNEDNQTAYSKKKLEELAAFVDDTGLKSATRQTCGTQSADEQLVQAIEQRIDSVRAAGGANHGVSDAVTITLHPSEVFCSRLCPGEGWADSESTYQLFDRVVCVREGCAVPVGARGTVIGEHPSPGVNKDDLQVDVLFDVPFAAGYSLRGSRKSAYKMRASQLMNLSFSSRKFSPKQVVQASRRQEHHTSTNGRHEHESPRHQQEKPKWIPLQMEQPPHPAFDRQGSREGHRILEHLMPQHSRQHKIEPPRDGNEAWKQYFTENRSSYEPVVKKETPTSSTDGVSFIQSLRQAESVSQTPQAPAPPPDHEYRDFFSKLKQQNSSAPQVSTSPQKSPQPVPTTPANNEDEFTRLFASLQAAHTKTVKSEKVKSTNTPPMSKHKAQVRQKDRLPGNVSSPAVAQLLGQHEREPPRHRNDIESDLKAVLNITPKEAPTVAIRALQDYCSQNALKLQYTRKQHLDDTVTYLVQVGSIRFSGQPCVDDSAARESAATIAMMNLSPPAPPRPPFGGFSAPPPPHIRPGFGPPPPPMPPVVLPRFGPPVPPQQSQAQSSHAFVPLQVTQRAHNIIKSSPAAHNRAVTSPTTQPTMSQSTPRQPQQQSVSRTPQSAKSAGRQSAGRKPRRLAANLG